MIYKNGKCLAYAVLLSTFVLTFSFLFQSVAFGQQDVKISPSCGPESGFNFDIIASGFTPNTNVNWQIIDSDENIPLYGYFQANSEGKISETTFADDLKKDNYKIYFGEDVDNDGEFDSSITPMHVDLNIPCENDDD